MSELSISDIELIARDIRRQDINYSHLFDELVDHVCCDIEYEMDGGLSFDEAYRKVKLRFAPGRFREIQKETLFAVDSKYRFMKNTMKISGIVGTIMFGVAALFKIQHWPGAGIMMTLGAFILAFIFLPSALGVLWKETHNKNRIFLFVSTFLTGFLFIAGTLFKVQHWPTAGIILTLSAAFAILMFLPSLLLMILEKEEDKTKRAIFVIAAAGSLFYILGMLFKIQHWPLATILTVLGIFVLGFIVLPWYSSVTWKNEKNIEPRYFFLLITCLAIIVPGALINLNLQSDYNEGYYHNIDRQLSLFNYLNKQNYSLLSEDEDTSFVRRSRLIHNSTMEIIGQVDGIKKLIVQESAGGPAIPVAGKPGESEINYRLISKPFEVKGVENYLMPGRTSRTALEASLKNYVHTVEMLFPDHKITTGILDPSFYLPAESASGMSLLSALNSLDLLRNSILSVESGILHSMKSQNNQLNALK